MERNNEQTSRRCIWEKLTTNLPAAESSKKLSPHRHCGETTVIVVKSVEIRLPAKSLIRAQKHL